MGSGQVICLVGTLIPAGSHRSRGGCCHLGFAWLFWLLLPRNLAHPLPTPFLYCFINSTSINGFPFPLIVPAVGSSGAFLWFDCSTYFHVWSYFNPTSALWLFSSSLVPSTVFPCRVFSCWQKNVDQRVVQSMQDLEVLGDATGAVHRGVLCSPVYTDAQ